MRLLKRVPAVLFAIIAVPALAQSEPTRLINGSIEACAVRASQSGNPIITCPSGVIVPTGYKYFRFSADRYFWNGKELVPLFRLPGGTDATAAYARGYADAIAASEAASRAAIQALRK